MANSKLSSKGKIGALKKSDGSVCIDPMSKAELLGDYFSSVFTKDDGSVPFPIPKSDDFPDGLNNVVFEQSKILQIIKKKTERW